MLLSARGRFIVRHGIIYCGVPLALAVFGWALLTHAAGRAAPTDPAWWRTIAALFVIAMLEWGVGAGWLIGAVWWGLTHVQDRRR
jgi:hypothetical protein